MEQYLHVIVPLNSFIILLLPETSGSSSREEKKSWIVWMLVHMHCHCGNATTEERCAAIYSFESISDHPWEAAGSIHTRFGSAVAVLFFWWRRRQSVICAIIAILFISCCEDGDYRPALLSWKICRVAWSWDVGALIGVRKVIRWLVSVLLSMRHVWNIAC